MSAPTAPVEILMVEDNPGDVELTREAFSTSKLANRLHIAEDGEEALDFLYRRGKFEHSPRPDIILLDLNLPKKDGTEVLEIIKSDEDLRSIPVIVFTSSQAEKDMVDSYRAYANCYITKPVNLDQFARVVQVLEDFWMNIVTLLPKQASKGRIASSAN